jgi:hypothetical protein
MQIRHDLITIKHIRMVLVIRCYSTRSNLQFNKVVNKMSNVLKPNMEAQSRL